MEILEKGVICMLKVIKTNEDYEEALKNIETSLDRDPSPGTPEANRLELLILLVKDYESKKFPSEAPNPIDAILFRMEQQNLTQRDLIPYIGSRSKVSEVLSGKRPLTLSMIRALHSGLGVPIKTLIQENKPFGLEDKVIEWNRFPINEMVKRGWIKGKLSDIRNNAEEVIKDFLKPLGSLQTALDSFYRRTNNIRSARPLDNYALIMWNARVIIRALEEQLPLKYKPGLVNEAFIKEVIKLSPNDNGPRLAHDFIRKKGIYFIIEPHLPGTHLDGAAIMTEKRPLIGLTLRHDRIDNFWFCLIHELVHIALHFKEASPSFYDDLDVDSPDPREQEVDKATSEFLIPEKEWGVSPASRLRTPEAAQFLATKLEIHPAIVAGKMRYYFKSYRILNRLVGHNQVRKHFPEVQWR
jgi:HTH-type transcriptional regulator/antitoxin HigA